MKIGSFLIVALAVALAFGVASAAASGWRVVGSGSSTGEFALKSISATVAHPRALGVRFIGHVDSGMAVVSCGKGFGVASWSRSYSNAGTFRLPMTRGADSCDVVASTGGSGRVTVQVLRG
jgi:hypothetical protein